MPYELGRPLGRPNDTALQRDILVTLIGLLAATEGPVLADYRDDGASAADASDLSGMACPISFKRGPGDETPAGQARQEIGELQPWFDLARERRGRTTFGAAGLDIAGAADLLIAASESVPPKLAEGETADPALVKLAAEDLKAFYLEAAGAQPSAMGSRDFAAWLWTETAGGRLLHAVHRACVASPDPAWRLVGANYIVPRAFWARLGIDAKNWQT